MSTKDIRKEGSRTFSLGASEGDKPEVNNYVISDMSGRGEDNKTE